MKQQLWNYTTDVTTCKLFRNARNKYTRSPTHPQQRPIFHPPSPGQNISTLVKYPLWDEKTTQAARNLQKKPTEQRNYFPPTSHTL